MHLMAHASRVNHQAAVIPHPHFAHADHARSSIYLDVAYPSTIRRTDPRKSAMHVLVLRKTAPSKYMGSLGVGLSGRPRRGGNPTGAFGNGQRQSPGARLVHESEPERNGIFVMPSSKFINKGFVREDIR